MLLLPFQKGICFCFKSHDYYYAECNKTVNSVKRSWRNYMARKATLLSWECKIQQTVTVFLEISGVCFHAFNVLIVFSGVTMSSYSHLLGHTIFRTHIVVIFFWGNVNTFGHKCISEWEKRDSFSPLVFWLVCIWAEMMWIWSRYLTKRNIFFFKKNFLKNVLNQIDYLPQFALLSKNANWFRKRGNNHLFWKWETLCQLACATH